MIVDFAPISFNGQTYKSMTLREPTIKEVILANEHATADRALPGHMHLISMVTGLPMEVVEKLKVSAYNKAKRFLDTFQTPADMPGTPPLPAFTINLPKATFNGKTYSTIHLEEPEIGAIDDALTSGGDNQYKQMVHMIAAVGQVPQMVAEKLPLSEFVRASAYLSSFLSVSDTPDSAT